MVETKDKSKQFETIGVSHAAIQSNIPTYSKSDVRHCLIRFSLSRLDRTMVMYVFDSVLIRLPDGCT
jgi:hypothetical protein